MTRKLAYLSLSFLALMLSSNSLAASYNFHQDHVLGTSFSMVVDVPNLQQAEAIKVATLSEITRLEKVLSTWDTNSEISQLNQTGSQSVSVDLFSVLQSCETFAFKTNGAFSCRLDELIKAWEQAAKDGQMLDGNVTQNLVSKAEGLNIKLDAKLSSVTMPVNFNFNIAGIAKGFIIDRALRAGVRSARSQGLSGRFGILLNIGGDVAVRGNLGGTHARIGILGVDAADNSAPVETLLLNNQALATSGSGKRDLVIGGRAYSHIISPFTGRPQMKTGQVSVVAPDAATADALATAFSTMGIASALLYANTNDGVDTMIITYGGARFTSNNWQALVAPVIKKTAVEAGVDNPLPQNFALEIGYEIERIDVSDYEYPYIVMWITDKDKKLVRPLTMIGKQPRWVEENYIFWRRVGRKFPAMVDSLSQPSRAPGHYSLRWDGYDQEGSPVPQGEYILHIETSREHGGHQYTKEKLHIGARKFEAIIDSGAELGQVDISYGPD